MVHLDLFSGIGGFSLAADRVFKKIEHTFVEIDPFCQEVLKKHWPNSSIYEDIKKFKPPKADIVTGGFPCQPFSQAGRRHGTADDRYLWPEMFNVIRASRPVWVIAENVGGLVTWNDGMVLEQVCTDLESEGYEVQPLIIPAVSKNAPHRRDRIWIIGYSEHNGFNATQNRESDTSRSDSNQKGQEEICQPEGTDSLWNYATNTERKRYKREKYKEGQSSRHSGRTQWDKHWFEVATELCRVDDGVSKRLDRNPRLKALGNAIVPQVAEEIFKAIKESWKQ